MKKLFTFLLACIVVLNTYAQNLGELNPDFGTNGSFLFNPSVSHDKMEKMLVQNDGKIITVGGARVGGSNYSIYASRHNADGTLDETYGENGIAYFKANPNIYMNYAFDATLNDDNHLFITGYTFDYSNNTAFILCLDENGIENTDFGENGFAISEYGNGIVYDAIDIDDKGRPIVAGYYNDNILVRRYNIKGNLDKSFGENGTVIIKPDPSPYAWSYAYDIEILENGKILLTGHKVSESGIYVSYLLRLRSNGSLDTEFGDEGILELHAGEYAEYAVSVSVQNDGKYIVAGHADLPPGESNLVRSEAFITRVNNNGTIDESFGNNGFVRLEPFEGDGCSNTSAYVTYTSDNQIFGTLYSYNALTQASRAYVYNLDINGNFKEDFAGSGIMALPKIDEEEVSVTTKSMAILDNSKLLVGGYIALDYSTNVQIFISCINININDEEPENPEDGERINELTSSLLLYPNPVNDKIYIETESEIEDIVVYDVYGRQQVTETTSHQGGLVIDVTDLKSGVYFVKVVTENGEAVKRIIKG